MLTHSHVTPCQHIHMSHDTPCQPTAAADAFLSLQRVNQCLISLFIN